VPNSASCPASKPFAVVQNSNGKTVGCHPTKAKAQAQLAALNINVRAARMDKGPAPTSASELHAHLVAVSPDGHGMDPEDLTGMSATDLISVHVLDHKENPKNHGHEDLYPITGLLSAEPSGTLRENLVRVIAPADYELRETDTGAPTLFGHFTPVGEWAEINSEREGQFMERSVEGFADESFQRSIPKVTFQHGRDPSMGDQVLGIPTVLRSDAYTEVPLFDGIPPLVMSGLRNHAYGMSYRFSVDGQDVNRKPGVSEHNPKGLPERTITKATVHEFGPVTFPAYATATAAVRSMTDWYQPPTFEDELARLAREQPKHLAAVIERALKGEEDGQPRAKPEPVPQRFRSREEFLEWVSRS
jgi:hypothetical protein